MKWRGRGGGDGTGLEVKTEVMGDGRGPKVLRHHSLPTSATMVPCAFMCVCV